MPSLSHGASYTNSARPLPLLSRLTLGFALTVVAWQDRLRTRRALSRLEAHRLADIGLDADYVASEINKPFWRA